MQRIFSCIRKKIYRLYFIFKKKLSLKFKKKSKLQVVKKIHYQNVQLKIQLHYIWILYKKIILFSFVKKLIFLIYQPLID